MDNATNVDYQTEIQDLRKKVLEDTDKLDQYDESDLNKFRSDDFYAGLFVKHSLGDVDKAVAMVKESLKWRKEFGVHGIKESTLPAEMLKEASIFKYNHDKEGNPIIMMIVKAHKKDAQKVEDQKRVIVYWIEKCLKESPNHAVSVLYDCADSGYSNMDLELTMFVTNLFMKYYPFSLGHIITYDMPWLFNAVWKVIKPLLPKHARNKVVFVNKTEIKEYIDDKCLPVRMGGLDTTEYVYTSAA